MNREVAFFYFWQGLMGVLWVILIFLAFAVLPAVPFVIFAYLMALGGLAASMYFSLKKAQSVVDGFAVFYLSAIILALILI